MRDKPSKELGGTWKDNLKSMKKMAKQSNQPVTAMLSTKQVEDQALDEQIASLMKDVKEQTKLQKAVYSKVEDRAKENLLLGSSSKLKKEDSKT